MYLRPHCQVNNSYVNNVTSVNLRQTGHYFIYLLNNISEPTSEMVKTDSAQILDKILDSETFANKEVLKRFAAVFIHINQRGQGVKGMRYCH